MREDWSIGEVTLIVSEYFDMLSNELSGQDYVKAEHRRRIAKLLNNRSEGSIEFKHQNISAVLLEDRWPYIPGYKPRGNYQQLLRETVEEYIVANSQLEQLVKEYSMSDISPPAVDDILMAEVDIPKFEFDVREPERRKYRVRRKTNYYQEELRNTRLGLLGEQFVISFEQQKLTHLGLERLAKKIEHISQTEGDSAGFDILSFDEEGKEKFIEVKTTQMGKDAPFYFSRNQLGFSQKENERFSLYRVFNFKRKPKFYQLRGALDKTCFNHPTEFLGWPK